MNPSITIVGRLASDPELRFMPNGKAVANLTIATSDRRKDGEEWTDVDPSFWRCSAFEKLAEGAAEQLTKGQAVIAQGKIKQRSYETRDGEKRTVFEVTLDAIGPDLRWAKPGASSGSSIRPQQAAADPWAANTGQAKSAVDPWAQKSTDEPPF